MGSRHRTVQSRGRGGVVGDLGVLTHGDGAGHPGGEGDGVAHRAVSSPRTLTQEDPGDNQVTLEEIMQMVSLSPARCSVPSCVDPQGRGHRARGQTAQAAEPQGALTNGSEFTSSPRSQ